MSVGQSKQHEDVTLGSQMELVVAIFHLIASSLWQTQTGDKSWIRSRETAVMQILPYRAQGVSEGFENNER